jgi:hypothetical protein
MDRMLPASWRLPGDWKAHGMPRVLVAMLVFFPLLSAALVVSSLPLPPAMNDFTAYWLAGEHVRTGVMLYGPVPVPPEPVVYRYAPWFAWLWAPATLLPESVVQTAWYLLLLAASLSVLLPMLRRGFAGWCTAAVMSVFFVDGAAGGNASPLMAALLFHALPSRRFGPLAIAATASLKGFPLILMLVYVGQRDWRSAALTLLYLAALVAPMLSYDLSHFAFAPLPTPYGLGTMPVLWVAAAAVGLLATLTLARTRYAWLVASIASLAAAPHLFLHYFTLIAPGVQIKEAGRGGHRS